MERLRPVPAGGASVDVELDGLGRVELRVEPIDGGLKVSLATDEPNSLSRLEAHRKELQGLIAGEDILGFDLGSRSRREHHAPAARPAPTRAAPPPTRRPGRGLVDVIA